MHAITKTFAVSLTTRRRAITQRHRTQKNISLTAVFVPLCEEEEEEEEEQRQKPTKEL